jgi:hypothetical protein
MFSFTAQCRFIHRTSCYVCAPGARNSHAHGRCWLNQQLVSCCCAQLSLLLSEPQSHASTAACVVGASMRWPPLPSAICHRQCHCRCCAAAATAADAAHYTHPLPLRLIPAFENTPDVLHTLWAGPQISRVAPVFSSRRYSNANA